MHFYLWINTYAMVFTNIHIYICKIKCSVYIKHIHIYVKQNVHDILNTYVGNCSSWLWQNFARSGNRATVPCQEFAPNPTFDIVLAVYSLNTTSRRLHSRLACCHWEEVGHQRIHPPLHSQVTCTGDCNELVTRYWHIAVLHCCWL